MAADPINIALLYDESAYVETLKRPARPSAGGPVGLMGRQVAGSQFLDAYLSHGTWTELVALVRSRASGESLLRTCREHPSSQGKKRRLRLVEERDFHATFFPTPPAPLLYTPCPPDPRYAWARQHGGSGAFALCGVTHTLCSAGAVQLLCDLVTAPYESYDALICTSQAVVEMVRSVTGAYADFLRDRHGGAPGLRVRLETIPLGVNPDVYRPATADERAAQRRTLNIADDEVAALFVGRLSHHAKAHPFPMFQGLAQAANTTGRKVHLVLCGWAANEAVLASFREGAQVFAPNVRVTFVDGTDLEARFRVWQAADLFTSLSDNVQETFGLVIVEAMASGLPVVASDWNGYRDLVVPGQTGYLVPTVMTSDASADATSRLLMGEVNYDHFLAECSQCVAVDVSAAAEAYARLLTDADLRRRLGAAGRQRVVDRFAWHHVVRAYEQLWRGQEQERASQVAGRAPARDPGAVPARYPALEHTFAGYPTTLLGQRDQLVTSPNPTGSLERLLATPLTNHSGDVRCEDPGVLQMILAAAGKPRAIAELDEVFRRAGVTLQAGRATLAWMLKYGLLQVAREESP